MTDAPQTAPQPSIATGPGLVRAILMVAAAYALTGELGLQLAIPPGYATAMWPPSGIALAAVLVWGGRIWIDSRLGEGCSFFLALPA